MAPRVTAGATVRDAVAPDAVALIPANTRVIAREPGKSTEAGAVLLRATWAPGVTVREPTAELAAGRVAARDRISVSAPGKSAAAGAVAARVAVALLTR